MISNKFIFGLLIVSAIHNAKTNPVKSIEGSSWDTDFSSTFPQNKQENLTNTLLSKTYDSVDSDSNCRNIWQNCWTNKNQRITDGNQARVSSEQEYVTVRSRQDK